MAIHHVFAGEVASVLPMGDRIGEGRTRAMFKSDDLEVISIVLLKGKSFPEHAVPGDITVQCIEGCVDFCKQLETVRMNAGDFLHLLGGEPHSLVAIDDASLLLTVSLRPTTS
jgi:quercetin dioxygenase-like cupin family protein